MVRRPRSPTGSVSTSNKPASSLAALLRSRFVVALGELTQIFQVPAPRGANMPCQRQPRSNAFYDRCAQAIRRTAGSKMTTDQHFPRSFVSARHQVRRSKLARAERPIKLDSTAAVRGVLAFRLLRHSPPIPHGRTDPVTMTSGCESRADRYADRRCPRRLSFASGSGVRPGTCRSPPR